MYFLKNRQRRLSLRFLSWFVLGEHIQQETHDSIEDARSALKLYNAFQKFEEQGIFDQKLEELYKEGRQYVRLRYHIAGFAFAHHDHTYLQNFKPPALPDQPTNSAAEYALPPVPTLSPYYGHPGPMFDSHFTQLYTPAHSMGGYVHRSQTNRNWRR